MQIQCKGTTDNVVVSKRTVDFHLANIYDKSQVNIQVQCTIRLDSIRAVVSKSLNQDLGSTQSRNVERFVRV